MLLTDVQAVHALIMKTVIIVTMTTISMFAARYMQYVCTQSHHAGLVYGMHRTACKVHAGMGYASIFNHSLSLISFCQSFQAFKEHILLKMFCSCLLSH